MIHQLLDRLERVRKTGKDRWSARCPAHDDRGPSLSIRQADDRVLIHCFAGCGAVEVLDAIGLSLTDLFDEPPKERRKPARPVVDYRQMLCCLRDEVHVIEAAAHMDELSAADLSRLAQARERIHEVWRHAHHL